MLTRLYVDNFRCFVNFECRFDGNKQLILGRNGSGKTSLSEVLSLLRKFAIAGKTDVNSLTGQADWFENQQIFEVEASIQSDSYIYRLVIEFSKEGSEFLVKSETVHCGQTPLFEFIDGQVHLYNDLFEPSIYPFNPYQSALATVSGSLGITRLIRFKNWFNRLTCFKLNPLVPPMSAARSEQAFPEVDLSNFVEWYLHLEHIYSAEVPALFKDLGAAIDGFRSLVFRGVGGGIHILFVEFDSPSKGTVELVFDHLSDGQRCLVYLYTILRFVVAKGGTVVIDEPENFLALREIQPWLMALTDTLDEGQGQAILLSHHPELINQWAFNHGIQLVRDGAGPVRAQKLAEGLEYALPAAELVARGWELE
jgi:predicted ATPase